MTARTIFSVGGCFAIFMASFLISGNAPAYFNATALIVVVSGTLGATLLSGGLGELKGAFALAGWAYKTEAAPLQRIIRELLALSVRVQRQGARSLDQRSGLHPDLDRAVRLVRDNFAENEIREILGSELYFSRMRQEKGERVFRNMASMAPSFGVAGSVIGMISLLVGIGETSLILTHIPVALISTLYGIIFGNFFLAPIAEKIRGRLESETLLMRVVLEGVSALAKEPNVFRLLERLNALVPPESRVQDEDMVRRIRRMALKEGEAGRIDREPVRTETELIEDQDRQEHVAPAVAFDFRASPRSA